MGTLAGLKWLDQREGSGFIVVRQRGWAKLPMRTVESLSPSGQQRPCTGFLTGLPREGAMGEGEGESFQAISGQTSKMKSEALL